MEKFIITLEALYDLLNKGKAEFYERENSATIQVEISDGDKFIESDDRKHFTTVEITKSSLMKLFYNRALTFENVLLIVEN